MTRLTQSTLTQPKPKTTNSKTQHCGRERGHHPPSLTGLSLESFFFFVFHMAETSDPGPAAMATGQLAMAAPVQQDARADHFLLVPPFPSLVAQIKSRSGE